MPNDQRFGVVKATNLPRSEARKPGRVTYAIPARVGSLGVLLERAGVKGRPVRG